MSPHGMSMQPQGVGGDTYNSDPFAISALEEDAWWAQLSGRFTPQEKCLATLKPRGRSERAWKMLSKVRVVKCMMQGPADN